MLTNAYRLVVHHVRCVSIMLEDIFVHVKKDITAKAAAIKVTYCEAFCFVYS